MGKHMFSQLIQTVGLLQFRQPISIKRLHIPQAMLVIIHPDYFLPSTSMPAAARICSPKSRPWVSPIGYDRMAFRMLRLVDMPQGQYEVGAFCQLSAEEGI